MTPEQFAYWLQGYAELTKGEVPSQEVWDSIREHLQTVFNKITPPVFHNPLLHPGPGIAYRKGLENTVLDPKTIITC